MTDAAKEAGKEVARGIREAHRQHKAETAKKQPAPPPKKNGKK